MNDDANKNSTKQLLDSLQWDTQPDRDLWPGAQQTYALQENFIEFQKSQISLIEQQHEHVRAQFVALLDGKLGPINPTTATEIRAVLLTIDQASMELKEAILAQPLNKSYSNKLAKTYQEELKLLNKFKAKNGLSI